MTKKEKQILEAAYDLLEQELGTMQCGSYAFGCDTCQISRFLEDYRSVIDFYLED